jgi:hypothetical protein
MLQILSESKGNVLGIRASGKLTDQDYRELLIPGLDTLIKEHGKARLLWHMDEDFTGWDMGAMWDDASYFLKHKNEFEKIAVVGGRKWIEAMMGLFAHFMPGEAKTYKNEELQEAWDWIVS